MLCPGCDAIVISIYMYEMISMWECRCNYMKCKYFWCVIILSHVIGGYTDLGRMMKVIQERGMEDRIYESE